MPRRATVALVVAAAGLLPFAARVPAQAAAAVPPAVIAGPGAFLAGFATPPVVAQPGAPLTFADADVVSHNVASADPGPHTPAWRAARCAGPQRPVLCRPPRPGGA